MGRLLEVIENTPKPDHNFVGTIAFKSEELTLPNGSVMALGIDAGHWVLVYQKEKKASFVVYEYDSASNSLLVDKKSGTQHDYRQMKELIDYFFSHAYTDDLVTILPSGGDYA